MLICKIKKIKSGQPNHAESIYFCFSGQITIWLISIFGNTTSIAEVGALGRLAMRLNIFTVRFSIIVIPWYAKLVEKK